MRALERLREFKIREAARLVELDIGKAEEAMWQRSVSNLLRILIEGGFVSYYDGKGLIAPFTGHCFTAIARYNQDTVFDTVLSLGRDQADAGAHMTLEASHVYPRLDQQFGPYNRISARKYGHSFYMKAVFPGPEVDFGSKGIVTTEREITNQSCQQVKGPAKWLHLQKLAQAKVDPRLTQAWFDVSASATVLGGSVVTKWVRDVRKKE